MINESGGHSIPHGIGSVFDNGIVGIKGPRYILTFQAPDASGYRHAVSELVDNTYKYLVNLRTGKSEWVSWDQYVDLREKDMVITDEAEMMAMLEKLDEGKVKEEKSVYNPWANEEVKITPAEGLDDNGKPYGVNYGKDKFE